MLRSILLFLVVVGLTAPLAAQMKGLTKQQYEDAQEKAHAKAEKVLRREVTVTTNYKDRKVDSIETVTDEEFPNGEMRWACVTKRGDEIVQQTQEILLGRFQYRREGSSGWTKTCIKDCSKEEEASGGGMSITGKEVTNVAEYFVATSTKFGGASYEYIFFRVYQMGSYLNFHDSRAWIGSDGLLIREESADSDYFPSNVRSTTVVTYEYNPTNIEPLTAPVP